MPVPLRQRWRKCIGSDEKVGLKINDDERKLILDDLMDLNDDLADAIRPISASQPVELTLDDWDYLLSRIASRVRHTKDKKVGKNLWDIYKKIQLIISGKGQSLLRGKPHCGK